MDYGGTRYEANGRVYFICPDQRCGVDFQTAAELAEHFRVSHATGEHTRRRHLPLLRASLRREESSRRDLALASEKARKRHVRDAARALRASGMTRRQVAETMFKAGLAEED